MPQSADEILAGAKKELAKANEMSPAKPAPKPAAAPKASSGLAAGLMSLVRGNKTTEPKPKEPGVGAELGSKIANVAAFNKANPDEAMPVMHDGGDVKKSGPHMLKKGEVVLPKKDAKAAVDQLKKSAGVSAGLKKAAKKEESAPKKNRPRRVNFERANGGWIARHEYDMPEDGSKPETPNEPFVIPTDQGIHDHVDQHMVMPQEA